MKYLICVTNRVGSSWLCSMLASTGVAGNPVEHFNLPADRWCDFQTHYEAIARIDPLGVKTSYQGLMAAIASVGRDEFRDTPCIWLQRRDTTGQAISNYRAMLTGQWLRRRGEAICPVEQAPDPQAIRRLAADYQDCNQRLWPAWFHEMGIKPLEIWYEDMCEAPEETIRAICCFLGFRDPPQIDTGRLQPQRDATNEQWRAAIVQAVQQRS
jgi:LPS sulfotransferase NodH